MESESKYIVTPKWGIIELKADEKGLWRDKHGTVFALADQSSADPFDRCGVAPFVLPVTIPSLEDGCKPHDYMYSSTAFQLFHTMHEANLEMLRLHNISTAGHWSGILKTLFYHITELAIPFMNWSGRKR